MKSALFAFLALLCPVSALLAAADDAAPKLMKADQDQLDKAANSHLKEATKAYDDYQKALADASDKTIKDLEKLKAAAMKNGNLNLAVAVDAREKDLRSGALADAVVANAKAMDNADLLGVRADTKLQKDVVGEWWLTSDTGWKGGLMINADGTCMLGDLAGKWVIAGGVMTMTYVNGNIDRMTTIDEANGAGDSNRGNKLTFAKKP